MLAHHPRIGQREQRRYLDRILGQALVAHFHIPGLALDHLGRILHRGPNRGFRILQFAAWLEILDGPHYAALGPDPERPPVLWRALFSPHVTCVAEQVSLLAMQQI